jgi:hypothetical protein
MHIARCTSGSCKAHGFALPIDERDMSKTPAFMKFSDEHNEKGIVPGQQSRSISFVVRP